MDVTASDEKLDRAMRMLETLAGGKIDDVVDLLVEVAIDETKLECVGHEGVHFVLGKNRRKSFTFDDCVGRFRSVLARLYSRCRTQFPYQMEGTIYGFDAKLTFSCHDGASARVRIKTSNTQGFPELLIEALDVK